MYPVWAASGLRAEARLSRRVTAPHSPAPHCPILGLEQRGCVSERLVERCWEPQPGRRRAIGIPVRQLVTELLLFLLLLLLFFFLRHLEQFTDIL